MRVAMGMAAMTVQLVVSRDRRVRRGIWRRPGRWDGRTVPRRYGDLRRRQTTSKDARGDEGVAKLQAAESALEFGHGHPGIDQCSDQHVAGRARTALDVNHA